MTKEHHSESSLQYLRYETPRLILREYQANDIEHLLPFYAEPQSHPFILKRQTNPDYVRENAHCKLQFAGRAARQNFHFIVELRSSGDIIGSIDVIKVWPGSSCATMGWHYGLAYAGHGYATEAARAMLRFLFVDYHVLRAVGDCFPFNGASIRIFQKLGMRRQFFAWFFETDLPKEYGEPGPIYRFVTPWNFAAKAYLHFPGHFS